MKQCSKCGEEKNLDQYQTYFHSTQGVHRTRGYCRDCYNAQKRRWKQSIKERIKIQPVSNMNEIEEVEQELGKVCSKCAEYKPFDKYYTHMRKRKMHTMSCCKQCYILFYANKRRNKPKDGKILISNYIKPNTYEDEEVKKDTFRLMHAMGWKFNEENGKWWKEGIKNPDGTFVNVRRKIAITRQRVPRFNQQDVQEMLNMRKMGMTFNVIGAKFNTSATSIINYTRHYRYENEEK